MSTVNSKTVGILGGMGPYATSLFFQKILQFTPATKDSDHLRVIIDSNPHIPSRSRYQLYNEASPVPGMIESCLKLQAYPVDFILVPCNSASAFLPEVQEKVRVPILNIVEATVSGLVRKFPEVRSVAVMGGVITYARQLYYPWLQRKNLTYVENDKNIQAKAEHLISSLKIAPDSEENINAFLRLVGEMRQQHPFDALILGCTELGFLADCQCACKLVDSNTEYARYAVEYALNK